MPYIYLYGTHLVYDDVGEGPTVILLGEKAGDWPEPLPGGYRFLLPDLPGRGRTEGTPLTPEEDAEFIVGLIMMLNLDGYRVLTRGYGDRVGEVLRDRMGLAEVCRAPDERGLRDCLGTG